MRNFLLGSLLVLTLSLDSFAASEGDYYLEDGRIYNSDTREELQSKAEKHIFAMDNTLIKTKGIGYTLRMRKVTDISEIFYYKNVLVLHIDSYENIFTGNMRGGQILLWDEAKQDWLIIGRSAESLYIQDGKLIAETFNQEVWEFSGDPQEFMDKHLARTLEPFVGRNSRIAFKKVD